MSGYYFASAILNVIRKTYGVTTIIAPGSPIIIFCLTDQWDRARYGGYASAPRSLRSDEAAVPGGAATLSEVLQPPTSQETDHKEASC